MTRDSGAYSLVDVLASRVPVSAFRRYRVSLQRKKRCQQVIGLNDESFPIAVRIDAKEKSVLGESQVEETAAGGLADGFSGLIFDLFARITLEVPVPS